MENSIQSLLADLETDPQDWCVRAQLCDALLLEGRLGEAVGLIETAPSPPEAERHVLKAAEVYGQSQPQKAVPLLYAFLQTSPSSALAHLAMAEAAVKLHQLGTAQSYYERAVELNPAYRDPAFEQKHGFAPSRPSVTPPAGISAPPLSSLPSAAGPDEPLTAPVSPPKTGTEASPGHISPLPLEEAADGGSETAGGVPGWVFTTLFAVATFLLCWMLLGLGLRAMLISTLSQP